MQSIIEIAEDGRHLSIYRGFLVVNDGQNEVARIPLDSIHTVLLNCHQVTLSQNILLGCVQNGIPVIMCGTNHLPQGILWPVESHYRQSVHMEAQVNVGKPLAKQLWKTLVQAKITAQYQATVYYNKTQGNALAEMANRVRSGDSTNLEAQAARRYWKLLFGSDFTRDKEACGVNSMLNYGYAILRAIVARAVMASGLHPSLGLYHRHPHNAFRLVDDLMEPFRPSVDCLVLDLHQQGYNEVTKDVKMILASLANRIISLEAEQTSINQAALYLAQSLAKSFLEKQVHLRLPKDAVTKQASPDCEAF